MVKGLSPKGRLGSLQFYIASFWFSCACRLHTLSVYIIIKPVVTLYCLLICINTPTQSKVVYTCNWAIDASTSITVLSKCQFGVWIGSAGFFSADSNLMQPCSATRLYNVLSSTYFQVHVLGPTEAFGSQICQFQV